MKVTVSKKIPVKIVKLFANIIDALVINIINNKHSRISFSDSAKIASVRSIYKKSERNDIQSYRPANVLKCFTKLFEKFLYD